MKITKEEFGLWFNHPVTKQFFICIEDTKKDLNDLLLSSLLHLDSKRKGEVMYRLGRRDMLDDLLHTNCDDISLYEEEDNND